MKFTSVSILSIVMWFVGIGIAWAQVYEFSRPNVVVNDDSLGRHWHYLGSAGLHSLLARGDTLCAVWSDIRDGAYKVYFSKSTNDGAQWTPNVVVNDTARATHFEPCIASGRDGRLYVSWSDDRVRMGDHRIYCASSTDGGATWGRNVVASRSLGRIPSICVGGDGRVFISYSTGRPYLSQSLDGGSTFTTYALTDTGYQVAYGEPSIGVDDSGLVYVTFAAHSPGGGGRFIQFVKAVDSADTSFLPPRIISDTSEWRSYPSLVTKPNGDTYIAFEAAGYFCQDIYLVKSTDRGRTFGPWVRVNDVHAWMVADRKPSISVDSGDGVYVTWSDNRPGQYSPDHGYFAVSTNGGISFGTSVMIEDTSGSPSASRYLQNLAVNPQTRTAYVIWSDSRHNSYASDIYSARGVLRVGVEEQTTLPLAGALRLKVSPNPFTSFATIPGHYAEHFTLYDISGRKVGVYKGDRVGADLPPGVYFLRSIDQGGKPLRVVKVR